MENQQNSRVRRILSEYRLRAVDSVLESSNIILFKEKLLGTTLDIIIYDAIHAKFTTDLQKSTFQALFSLTLRGSTIILL